MISFFITIIDYGFNKKVINFNSISIKFNFLIFYKLFVMIGKIDYKLIKKIKNIKKKYKKYK